MLNQIIEHSDKISHLSYLNDDVFKSFINLADEDSIFLTKQLIYLTTGLKVDAIKKVDRVMDRKIVDAKSSTVDFIALVDGKYINIEVQKIMDKFDLLPKIQMYQSHVIVSQNLKGIKEFHKIQPVISIIFYEGIYIDDNQLISRYEYDCRERERDPNNKMSTYLIELGKINQIYQQKHLSMNKLERICFAIKNSDNKQFYDILKVIEKEEKEVTIMSKKYGLFREDIAEYMTAINAEMKETANRSYYTNQGIAQGKRDTLIRQMKKKYPSQDVSWLDDCHLDQLEYALDIILDGYTFEEFKQKVLDY